MAASPQVTVRLHQGTYKALVKIAALEQKTIADVTRELIQMGAWEEGSARDRTPGKSTKNLRSDRKNRAKNR